MKFFTIDDSTARIILTGAFGLVVLTTAVILLKYRTLPPQVPLLYSRPWGEEQLVNKPFLFGVPVVLTILILINFFLISFYDSTALQKNIQTTKRDQTTLIARMFATSILLVTVLGTMSVIRIVLLL